MAAFAFAVPDPTPGPPPGGPDPTTGIDPAPPAWFALRYSLPEAAVRAAVWRALKDMEAINVQRSIWAVRDDPEHHERVAELAERIVCAGGRSSVHTVTGGTADDLMLHSRLHRACERLWDDLCTQADWYDARAARAAWSPTDRVTALAGLFEQFGTTVGVDLVGSDAGTRMEARLRRSAEELAGPGGADPFDWCREHPVSRRRVLVTSEIPRLDGSRTIVARVHPAIDPLWELAFERFEVSTYRPDPSRIPLRGTAFRWTTAPGAHDDGLAPLARLEDRVTRADLVLR